MTLGKLQGFGLIVLCAVLTPFLLDICLGLLPFIQPTAPGIVYTFICLGLFVAIVGLLAAICIRLVPALNAANALLFTLVSLVAMRIDHLLTDQPQFVELNEAIGLILACLIVFCTYLLWRGRGHSK